MQLFMPQKYTIFLWKSNSICFFCIFTPYFYIIFTVKRTLLFCPENDSFHSFGVFLHPKDDVFVKKRENFRFPHHFSSLKFGPFP